MTRQMVRACSLVALMVVAGGCARPRLAARAMTEDERFWSARIGVSYPGWQPPYLTVTRDVDPAAAAAWGDSPGIGVPTSMPLPPPATGPAVQAPFVITEIELVPMDGTPVPQPAQPTSYTVRKGDTLSRIAREQLGNAGAAKVIFEHNRDVLASPDKIREGMILKIPPRD